MATTTVYQRCYTPCEEHISKAPNGYPGECKTCNSQTGDAMRVYAQTQANKRQSYTFSPAKLKWWEQGSHDRVEWAQRLSLWDSAVAGWDSGTIPAITKSDLRQRLASARQGLDFCARTGTSGLFWLQRIDRLNAKLAS